MKKNKPREGDLRVWHKSAHFGGPPYETTVKLSVSTVEEGRAALRALADYDLALGDLVLFNAQGLLVFRNGQWEDYEETKVGA